MENKEEMITITLAEYRGLMRDSEALELLHGAGVDNWCGYYDALESLEEED
jgi:hypothetical protein